MENKKIVFVEPWKVEVQYEQLQTDLQPNEVLVKKIYSMISPGTELACLSRVEDWFKMPAVPGYSSVSEIIDKGKNVNDFEIGDKVFHYGIHSQYEVITTEGVFLEVPRDIDLKHVPFTRLATVAFTSIRTSTIELGDYVAVTGMGIVGNLAAQLATLQGATVIGLDLSEARLQHAKSCGIDHVINSSQVDPKGEIYTITNGSGVSTLIEATGVPKVAVDSLEWIGSLGEIILLGTPRGEYHANITDVLRQCHLYGNGCITFKGAHEWRYPIKQNEYMKHSLTRNSLIAFNLLKEEKLKIDSLISHVIKPEEAPRAYEGLRMNKDQFNGVLFDWM